MEGTGGEGCIHSQADLVSSAARQAAVHGELQYGEGESPGIDAKRRATGQADKMAAKDVTLTRLFVVQIWRY